MRFTLGSAKGLGISLHQFETLEGVNLGLWDRWIVGRLAETLSVCSQSYSNYNFHLATAALKTFFYQYLCDTYLVSWLSFNCYSASTKAAEIDRKQPNLR